MVALDEHFRHSATAVRTHWHLIGKSVPSAQSADHVPTLATRPLFTSATSVVNINGPGTRTAGRRFGTPESSRKGHRPLAAERRADALDNALDFTPSSAITDYLYDQQYYDVISGQYYMRARNYDPTTGTFTQQDSYTINPGDLANANLYLYAGADPINMFDPSGDFGIADVAVSISISMALGNGLAFGAVSALNGGGIKGFISGFAEGALFGGEAGLTLIIATGSPDSEVLLPQVIASGIIGGLSSVIIDEAANFLTQSVTHQSLPGFGQEFEDFAGGFASSAISTAFKGGVGFAEGTVFSIMTSFIGQEIRNIDSPNPAPIGKVFESALISGIISGLVSGTLKADLIRPSSLDPNLVRNGLENPTFYNYLWNAEIGGLISSEIGTIIKEVGILS